MSKALAALILLPLALTGSGPVAAQEPFVFTEEPAFNILPEELEAARQAAKEQGFFQLDIGQLSRGPMDHRIQLICGVVDPAVGETPQEYQARRACEQQQWAKWQPERERYLEQKRERQELYRALKEREIEREIERERERERAEQELIERRVQELIRQAYELVLDNMDAQGGPD